MFGLPRYSEDPDFALERGRDEFDLRTCLKTVRSELAAEDYRVDVRPFLEQQHDVDLLSREDAMRLLG